MTQPILRGAVLAATLAIAASAPASAFADNIQRQAEALKPAVQQISDPYRRGVAEGFLEIAQRQDSHVLVSTVYDDAARKALGNARYLIDGTGAWQPLYSAKNWPTRDKWAQSIRTIEATNARASASTCKSEAAGRLLALTDEVWKEQAETHGTRWVHGWDAIDRAKTLSVQVNDELDRCPPPVQPVANIPEPDKPVSLSADALFDFDSATLKPEGIEAIDVLAARLKRLSAIDDVGVTGYTDRFGTVAHNRDLSRRRAQAVADALKDRGVNPARFDVRGAGASAPVAICPGAKSAAVIACLAPNRRVELRVSGQMASAAPAVSPAAGTQSRQAQPQAQAVQLEQPPQRQQLQLPPQTLQRPAAQP